MVVTVTTHSPQANLPPRISDRCGGTEWGRSVSRTRAHLPWCGDPWSRRWGPGISRKLRSREAAPQGSGNGRIPGSPVAPLPPPPPAARPCARAPPPAPGSAAPLSLSRLRRCLPGRARGRAGRRGGARRSASGGGRGPGAGSSLRALAGPEAARVSAAVRAARPVAAAAIPPRAPSRRHAAGPRRPPTVGVGQRRGGLWRARRGAASRGGQPESRKRNFSLPPPARSPESARSPAGGNCT